MSRVQSDSNKKPNNSKSERTVLGFALNTAVAMEGSDHVTAVTVTAITGR